jgi:predicted alpha/beta hydrolase family esterase
MKNALIVHGTEGYPTENWFDWLRQELENEGWKIWVPQLPESDKPDVGRYNKFLFSNKDWKFDSESIIVGHSSGAVATLGILQDLPEGIQIDTAYFIGIFKDAKGWDSLEGLFARPFDFEKIKKSAKRFIFIHSDDDPYCPKEDAQYFAEKLGGELIVQKGQKHFSIETAGESYSKFPFLLNLIKPA